MNSNFNLKTQRQNHHFRIDLHGVFDGASAFELVRAIERGYDNNNTVLIDTEHLTSTCSFGKAVLESNLPKRVLRAGLHFSGIRAKEIMPEGCTLFNSKDSEHHRCNRDCKNCSCQNKSVPTHRIAHN